MEWRVYQNGVRSRNGRDLGSKGHKFGAFLEFRKRTAENVYGVV